ncbi:GNAT family N-acetyltransferase [Nocardioides currus]|uniref:GNAT family N-acetyltransferase n=1 Tax=Nocardioides currus TaxID=2133958 RepID=A0A2R7YV83_9ACTN|nr:GNAT family N-acetyltransferase [Nocardioides currus]PUA80278.1 GNAT family N-acetyltransferase [Nocardioides currus]
MELRLAEPDELDAVGDLTVAAYVQFTTGPNDSYVAKLRDAATRAAQAELWVAVEDGRLMGTVTSCPPGSAWHEIATDHEGEFRMLAVHPDARGRGVGTALATLCEDRAREHGASAMVLSTLREMTGAHRIYERLGYERVPERDWSPLPGVQLIAFAKQL